MSLNGDFAQSAPITILKDTGASQSITLADTLPFSKKTSSGTSVLFRVQNVDMLMFRSITFICLLTKLMVQWLLVSDKLYLSKVFIYY